MRACGYYSTRQQRTQWDSYLQFSTLEIRKRSDYDFALALVPGPSNLACKGRGEFQRYEAEDKKFSIEVFSEPVSNSLARIRVVVTNKEIMFGDRTNGDHVEVGPKMMMTNDVEVLIGDL